MAERGFLMKKLFVLSVTLFVIVNILHIYAEGEKEKIAENVLRLHVVAESNLEKDQKIKIRVRDAVLSNYGNILSSAKNKKEAIELFYEYEEEILKTAKEELIKNGASPHVSVSIGKYRFPTKVYGNVRLPGGEYDAVNIKIGKAKGENWWCVMYPPMCFTSCIDGKVAEENLDRLKKNLGEGRFSLISDDSKDIKIKFKILELFAK